MNKKLENSIKYVLEHSRHPKTTSGKLMYIEPLDVIELLKKDYAWGEVAKIYNCCIPSLVRIVKRVYPDFSVREFHAYGIKNEELVRLYKESGRDVGKVAEYTSMRSHTVRARLHKIGAFVNSTKRSDLTPERVASLYDVVRNINKLARILNTNNITIEDRLKKAGITRRYSPISEKKRPDILDTEIIKMYKETRNPSSIARRFKTSRSTIVKRLKKYKIKLRSICAPRPDITRAKVLKMRADGHSTRQIANHFNCSTTTILYRIKTPQNN